MMQFLEVRCFLGEHQRSKKGAGNGIRQENVGEIVTNHPFSLFSGSVAFLEPWSYGTIYRIRGGVKALVPNILGGPIRDACIKQT